MIITPFFFRLLASFSVIRGLAMAALRGCWIYEALVRLFLCKHGLQGEY